MQIDLGATFPVNKVIVWQFNGDGRTYHNTKTQVSADGSNWTTVFDSATQGEYAETLAGKTHTFTQQNVRYVRDYLNGSTANIYNHWVEIEVWGTTTSAYIGNYYEWNGSAQTMTRYYGVYTERSRSGGGTLVAVRNSNGTGTNGLVYLLGDHLGSTSITADPVDGDKLSELRFKAWGETRYSLTSAPTDRRFTGQIEEAGLGLYFYGARYYDPVLSRFTQADTIIPSVGDVQAWDRYAYSYGNPVKYIDPDGHWPSPSKILSIGATICDLTATALSGAGIVVEVVAAVGGEMLTPFPGADGATGLAAGVVAYNKILNPIENELGVISLGLVAAADYLDNNHQLDRIQDPISGQEVTEFVLGADTTFSLASVAVGNTPITPDAFTDTLANLATLHYDVSRLGDNEPIWGLVQIKIVKPENNPGYIEFIRENQGDKNDRE